MIMDPEKNELENKNLELDINELEGVNGGVVVGSIRPVDRTGIAERAGLTDTGKTGESVRYVDHFKRTPDLDV